MKKTVNKNIEVIGALGRRWCRNCGQRCTFIRMPSGEEHLIHSDGGWVEGETRDDRIDERLNRGCSMPEEARGGAAVWAEERLFDDDQVNERSRRGCSWYPEEAEGGAAIWQEDRA